MKHISWEKFNDLKEELDEPQPFGGVIFGPANFSQTSNNYEDYNFFIAHCNFYVTTEVVNTVCSVEGIESFDALSPYRFRISVGKLFEPQEILDTIEEKLTKE